MTTPTFASEQALRWAEALDAFEASLDDHRRAAESGQDGPVRVLGPGAGLGPLPPALAPRAAELLARCRRLEAELMVRRGLLVRRLSADHSAARPPACYFDATA